ncbi:hypothetical protein [Actinomadura chibensis]|uniref:hypothetical protein n=1 Tax=Actinomadura chibensis TaxID=392828 RepID=UPI0012F980CA|nr:hypothetical protein [Actinomadura chibensis]
MASPPPAMPPTRETLMAVPANDGTDRLRAGHHLGDPRGLTTWEAFIRPWA